MFIAVLTSCLFAINGLIHFASGLAALSGKSFAGIILGFINLIIALYCTQITGFSFVSLALLVIPIAYLAGAFIQDRQDQADIRFA